VKEEEGGRRREGRGILGRAGKEGGGKKNNIICP
jgi:hypothetical protein